MNNWKPEVQFLDFIQFEFIKDPDNNESLTANIAGDVSLENIIDQMRIGTPFGKELYQSLYDSKVLYASYQEYLKNSN